MRLERFERLRFEALFSHVPEHRCVRRVIAARFIAAAESNVQNRRAVAFDDRNRTAGRLPPEATQADARHAERQVAVLRIGVLGMMARRAGYVFGSRQKRVPEQQPSQRNFCWGRRVVSRRLRSRRQRRYRIRRQRRYRTLSNGANFHVKECGDRSCCDQQSGKVFPFEEKFTEWTFHQGFLLSHALLRFQSGISVLDVRIRESYTPPLSGRPDFFVARPSSSRAPLPRAAFDAGTGFPETFCRQCRALPCFFARFAASRLPAILPARAAPRSGAACRRTAGDGDVPLPRATSSSAHASRAVRRSSRAAASNSSPSSWLSVWATPPADTGSRGCRPGRSVAAALRLPGTDDTTAASSASPACLP